jgi:hypothetical protein
MDNLSMDNVTNIAPAMFRRAARERAAPIPPDKPVPADETIYMSELGGYVTPEELAAVPTAITAPVDAANQRVAEIMIELKSAEVDRTTARRALACAISEARPPQTTPSGRLGGVDDIFVVRP